MKETNKFSFRNSTNDKEIMVIPVSLYQIVEHPDCMYAEAIYDNVQLMTIIKVSGYPCMESIIKIINNRFNKYVENASLSGWCPYPSSSSRIKGLKFTFNNGVILQKDMPETEFMKLYKSSYGKIVRGILNCWRPLMKNEPITNNSLLEAISKAINETPSLATDIMNMLKNTNAE